MIEIVKDFVFLANMVNFNYETTVKMWVPNKNINYSFL